MAPSHSRQQDGKREDGEEKEEEKEREEEREREEKGKGRHELSLREGSQKLSFTLSSSSLLPLTRS